MAGSILKADLGNCRMTTDLTASCVADIGYTYSGFTELNPLSAPLAILMPAGCRPGPTRIASSASDKLIATIKVGKVLATAEENFAELNERTLEFTAKRLPILQALQIA